MIDKWGHVVHSGRTIYTRIICIYCVLSSESLPTFQKASTTGFLNNI